MFKSLRMYNQTVTLTCWDRALNPKSETLRFPEASNSKFSGCIMKACQNKGKTTKPVALRKIRTEINN